MNYDKDMLILGGSKPEAARPSSLPSGTEAVAWRVYREAGIYDVYTNQGVAGAAAHHRKQPAEPLYLAPPAIAGVALNDERVRGKLARLLMVTFGARLGLHPNKHGWDTVHAARDQICKELSEYLAALSPTPSGETVDPCLSKKLPNEPYFVLLGRDPQAPDLVEKWAADRQAAEGWSQKVAGAVLIAALMRAFKDENPDLGMSADLLASSSASPKGDDRELRSLLEFEPDLGAGTPEQPLRFMIYKYYRAHFDPDSATDLTNRYIAALSEARVSERSSIPSKCEREADKEGDEFAELRRAALAATPGPWDIYAQLCATKEDVDSELTAQVRDTEGFAGALYLMNAGGKCPALTGCGPTSKANAEYLAAANPSVILALLDRLSALSKREARPSKEGDARNAVTSYPICTCADPAPAADKNVCYICGNKLISDETFERLKSPSADRGGQP